MRFLCLLAYVLGWFVAALMLAAFPIKAEIVRQSGSGHWVCRNQSDTLVLHEWRGDNVAAAKISDNAHEGSLFSEHASVSVLAGNGNSEYPLRIFDGLFFGGVEKERRGIRLHGGCKTLSDCKDRSIRKMPAESKRSVDRQGEATLIDDIEPNPQSLRASSVRFVPLDNFNPPVVRRHCLCHRSRLHGRLLFNGPKRVDRSIDTAEPDKNKARSSDSCNASPSEHPSIKLTMILFLCFGFGGLLLCFLPLYWCLLMPRSVNYQGALFRAIIHLTDQTCYTLPDRQSLNCF
jgi:hypothetical protein